MCISDAVQEDHHNWKSGKSEKLSLLPAIEAVDGVARNLWGASVTWACRCMKRPHRRSGAAEDERDLNRRQCDIFLNPNDPAIIEQARKDEVPDNVIKAAQASPVYKLAMDWGLALPRTRSSAPCRWSGTCRRSPPSSRRRAGHVESDGVLPKIESLRIPVRYLANMLTAGDETPVVLAQRRWRCACSCAASTWTAPSTPRCWNRSA